MKNKILFIVLSVFLTLFFFKLYRVYSDHFSAFGCFDECFNYVSGFFMLKGRTLYSQIYFNHQMLMAYLSFLLQAILHPQSIYFLVLEHRLFIFFFGVIMNIFLIARFGLPAVGFAVIFEATKFYFMGSLFLAESLLVYPLVYLFALAWQKLLRKKVFTFDYIFAALSAWAVIFLREPAILAAVFLYGVILFCKDTARRKLISFLIFALLTVTTLLSIPWSDYISQVWVYNAQTAFASEVGTQHVVGFGILKVFLYPLFILFNGKWTFVREILIGVDILFIISLIALFIKRRIKIAIFLLVALGLTNIRVVPPGTIFYEAFHMLPWYALFVFTTFLLLKETFLLQIKRAWKYGLIVIVLLVSCYIVISPKSFIWEKVDRKRDFNLSFDTYYVYGEAVKQLAKSTDTLFLDGWNELIYWQANLNSPYKYSRTEGSIGNVLKLVNARADMFANNPPDFYYSLCSGKTRYFGFLPDFLVKDYVELVYVHSPSCLFVKKSKLSQITTQQWDSLKVLRFYLPESR